jgi:hypothetical protein
MLVVPFRVFGSADRPSVSPPQVVLLGLATRPESQARSRKALIA